MGMRMSRVAWMGVVALGAALAGSPRAAESNAPVWTNAAPVPVAWRGYALPSITNLQALRDPAGDAVYRGRDGGGSGAPRISSGMAESLARTGEEVFDSEHTESSTGSDVPGVHSITFKTSYLDLLRATDRQSERNALALSSTIDVDTERGTYEFRKLGLGLLDNALWLTRELPEEEDDEDTGSYGLEFRMDW